MTGSCLFPCTSGPGSLCQWLQVTFLSQVHITGPVFCMSDSVTRQFLDLWLKCWTEVRIKPYMHEWLEMPISKLISWIIFPSWKLQKTKCKKDRELPLNAMQERLHDFSNNIFRRSLWKILSMYNSRLEYSRVCVCVSRSVVTNSLRCHGL